MEAQGGAQAGALGPLKSARTVYPWKRMSRIVCSVSINRLSLLYNCSGYSTLNQSKSA